MVSESEARMKVRFAGVPVAWHCVHAFGSGTESDPAHVAMPVTFIGTSLMWS